MQAGNKTRRRAVPAWNSGTKSFSPAAPRALLISFILIFTSFAAADNRDQVYSFGLATRNIYQVNANGTVTSVFTNYAGTTTAAAAQRASDGMIYFVTQVANGQVYRWDPATPATAPVLLGTTGAAIPYFPRLAF